MAKVLKDGSKVRWRFPSGKSATDTMVKIDQYGIGKTYGKYVQFIGKYGSFRAIALDWITHIDGKRVRRGR